MVVFGSPYRFFFSDAFSGCPLISTIDLYVFIFFFDTFSGDHLTVTLRFFLFLLNAFNGAYTIATIDFFLKERILIAVEKWSL